MLTHAANTKIYLFREATDMRKGFEGLSGLVETAFQGELTNGAYFGLSQLEKVACNPKEERLQIRREKEIPRIDELITRVKTRLVDGKLLPKSKFREALGYFCSLIPHLKNYTR